MHIVYEIGTQQLRPKLHHCQWEKQPVKERAVERKSGSGGKNRGKIRVPYFWGARISRIKEEK